MKNKYPPNILPDIIFTPSPNLFSRASKKLGRAPDPNPSVKIIRC
jgi:hypothetical protein